MPPQPSVQTLDPAMVAFITSHLSIHMAAANDQLQVTLVRGIGCRVSDNRDRITVLAPRSQSEPLVRAIGRNNSVAAVFNQPETHRTVQFKGTDARIEPATEQDKASLPAYLQGFSERLKIYGVKEIYIHTLCACEPDDMLAVSFAPMSIYQQSPGAEAGRRLPPGAPLP
ncbi:hypothetical protein [Bowmanella dokdonensis]|uniref:Uncharacterized protein n=1 Tax=Bowmanella dokdonensis TaxID=751969 RepID=A0A939IMN6_9ALTE|nr:hypothetical protein [Bowmanella dokdonensis]MBN7825493.1 hypothetical protein [Bowmanella dokdonensis]